jgi:hypothetical protein
MTINFYCNKQKMIYRIGLENLAYHQDLFVKISGLFDSLINVYDFFPEEV